VVGLVAHRSYALNLGFGAVPFHKGVWPFCKGGLLQELAGSKNTSGRRPEDPAILEIADVTTIASIGLFVSDWVAKARSFPSPARPVASNEAVNLVSASRGRPVDRASLKMVETSNAIRSAAFVGGREAKERILPAEAPPLLQERAMDRPRPR
jgi:hypothetical protein